MTNVGDAFDEVSRGGQVDRGQAHAAHPQAVRVLVADDDPSTCAVLGRLISAAPSLELVGIARDGESAVDLALQTHPDVVLVDVRMPNGGGVGATRRLREHLPSTKILALSGAIDHVIVLQMLSAGAVGYVVKGGDVDIVQAIAAAHHGQGVLSNEIAADIIGELSQRRGERGGAEDTNEETGRVRRAMSEDAIRMVFQPIVDLGTGLVAGVEALARFGIEPSRTPDVWFQEAWDVGLGYELEMAAAEGALRETSRLDPRLFLSVNFSPQAVADTRFTAWLEDHGRPQPLVLELTEHAVVGDYKRLNTALATVRDLGARVSVDDTGAGYASMRHIIQVTPEYVKLDISLVEGIDQDSGKRTLAEALFAFAHEIGAKVVAEGIETPGQLECVRQIGIDYGQGYYLGRPMALSAYFPASELVS